jgi:RNA polymerase sigma factor (TIGR02999 family)
VPGDITQLLKEWRDGNAEAGERVVAQTYGELRRVAHAQMRRERPGHTLQTTALLHDAYMRLLRKGPGTVESREAFFRLMALEMRHRLVDAARRRVATKRGGGVIHYSLEGPEIVPGSENLDDLEGMLERLDRALRDLNRKFPRPAQVVQLRFIAGLTTEEVAARLSLSPGTIKRDWTFARAWLAAAMELEPTRKTRQ